MFLEFDKGNTSKWTTKSEITNNLIDNNIKVDFHWTISPRTLHPTAFLSLQMKSTQYQKYQWNVDPTGAKHTFVCQAHFLKVEQGSTFLQSA